MTDLSPVRGAVPEDEDAILDLCYGLHEEIGLWPLSKEKVQQFVHCAIYKECAPSFSANPTIGVIGEKSKPQAAIGFGLMQHWFSDEWFMGEYFLYVHPEYRKMHHAESLIQWAKSCCDKVGLALSIGVLSNHRTEAKIRIFRRVLGEPNGAFFTYRPKRVA